MIFVFFSGFLLTPSLVSLFQHMYEMRRLPCRIWESQLMGLAPGRLITLADWPMFLRERVLGWKLLQKCPLIHMYFSCLFDDTGLVWFGFVFRINAGSRTSTPVSQELTVMMSNDSIPLIYSRERHLWWMVLLLYASTLYSLNSVNTVL